MLEPISLPALPYQYDALEPVISAQIMEIHHNKHHQAYVDGYNRSLAQLKQAEANARIQMLLNLLPTLSFNAGGHINHSLFWENLAPEDSVGKVSPELLAMIQSSFGSQAQLEESMKDAGLALQGSGWVWLGYDPNNHTLRIATTANQDTLEASHNLIPLLGIDVWEHAYYLQYKNQRGTYLDEIWRVINWDEVSHRLDRAAGMSSPNKVTTSPINDSES